MPRILAFAGSARQQSFNFKLVQIALKGAEAAGAEVTLLNLRDSPLPLFNQDLEAEGTPENVFKLKDLFKSHDGFLISCPEYNSSITPLLKNTIDWVSRPAPNETPLECFKGKVAALMSASPGKLGGLRGLVHVRSILGNIGVLVLPTQVAVSGADEAFYPHAQLKDPRQQSAVEGLGAELTGVLGKLRG